MLPRGRLWCRRCAEGCEALVSLLESPHPGPSNAGPEASLGAPGEPPGSEGPGGLSRIPALQPRSPGGTRAPRAWTPRGLRAAPLPRPLRTQCRLEPWNHLPVPRPGSEIRCLRAAWPGCLLSLCSLGTSETCRTTRPGHSHGAQLCEGPAAPAAHVASRPCVCSPLPSVCPPQVRWQQRPAPGRADAGEHSDDSGPGGRMSSSPPSPRRCQGSLQGAAASPTKARHPGPSCIQKFPGNSETRLLGAQPRAPCGHDPVTRPGKGVQVAGRGGGCCVVTGVSASGRTRASETQTAWALPGCRARGTPATRCHCPHSAARAAGPPAPKAAEVGVLIHTCSRARPETRLLTHPDTHPTPELARRVPASLMWPRRPPTTICCTERTPYSTLAL